MGRCRAVCSCMNRNSCRRVERSDWLYLLSIEQARDKCFKTAKSNKARDKKAAYRAKGIELQKAAAEKKAAK